MNQRQQRIFAIFSIFLFISPTSVIGPTQNGAIAALAGSVPVGPGGGAYRAAAAAVQLLNSKGEPLKCNHIELPDPNASKEEQDDENKLQEEADKLFADTRQWFLQRKSSLTSTRNNVMDWVKSHTSDPVKSFFRHIASGLHRFKYSVANHLLWGRLRKFANRRLEPIAQCLGYNSLADVPTQGVNLKKCHPFRTSMMWLAKFGAAGLHVGSDVSVDELKEGLPCLTKYFAREKLGVKEETEAEQKSQKSDSLKAPAAQAQPVSAEEFPNELEPAEETILRELEAAANGAQPRGKRHAGAYDVYLMEDGTFSLHPEHERFTRAVSGAAVAGIYIGTLPAQVAIPIIVVSIAVGIIGGIVVGYLKHH